jgi:hypothetical protein
MLLMLELLREKNLGREKREHVGVEMIRERESTVGVRCFFPGDSRLFFLISRHCFAPFSLGR